MPSPGSTNYDFPCIAADYSVRHPLPRYRDNVLISAVLAHYPSTDEELRRHINVRPSFEALLNESPMVRRTALAELLRFRTVTPPLRSTIANIHSFMLESYVGREPHSGVSQLRLAETFQHMKDGTFPAFKASGAQFSSAIFGMSGCGKTFAIEAAEELYRLKAPVVHHETFGLYQIPLLKLSMPFLGSSRLSLGAALIHEISKLFPPGDYVRLYLQKSRMNSNTLLLQALALLQIHKVGIVIIDEGQGDPGTSLPEGAVRKEERLTAPALTTTVIAGSNQAGCALMIAGTRELERMLNSRMTLIRRTTGPSFEPLDWNLSRGKVSEFDLVFTILWARQLVSKPVKLTMRWRSIFYFFSRGIPEIFVKLFRIVQEKAIDNNMPQFTEELVYEVAQSDMKKLCEIGVALHFTGDPSVRRVLWKKPDVRPVWVDWDLYAETEAMMTRVPHWSFKQAVDNIEQWISGGGNSSTEPAPPAAGGRHEDNLQEKAEAASNRRTKKASKPRKLSGSMPSISEGADSHEYTAWTDPDKVV